MKYLLYSAILIIGLLIGSVGTAFYFWYEDIGPRYETVGWKVEYRSKIIHTDLRIITRNLTDSLYSVSYNSDYDIDTIPFDTIWEPLKPKK